MSTQKMQQTIAEYMQRMGFELKTPRNWTYK